MRVLVTGARDWPDAARDVIFKQLDGILVDHAGLVSVTGGVTVVHGACHLGGADEHADQWARQSPHAQPEPHPAADFGAWPDCGPKRNRHMVSLGADLCLAFPRPGSKGTWGCEAMARAAGIPTRIVRLPDDPPKRVQRSRTKGSRLPAGAIAVDRTSRYGNPFTVAEAAEAGYEQPARVCVSNYDAWLTTDEEGHWYQDTYTTGARTYDRLWIRDHITDLAGHNLACYCPVDQPWCHATTLLALANGGQP